MFDESPCSSPVVDSRDRLVGCQISAKIWNASCELVEQVHLFDQGADRLGYRIKVLVRSVLSLVVTRDSLGVLFAESREASMELIPVGLVEPSRLGEFFGRIHERLLLVGLDIGVHRHCIDDPLKPPMQVGERAVEGGEYCRYLRAFIAHPAEVVPNQRKKTYLLTAIKPDNGGDVLHLLGREVVDLACDLAVGIAHIEHQHLIAALRGLNAVEEPKFAGDGACVEEVGADRDHYVHVAGFYYFFPHVLLSMPSAGSLRGHDESCSTSFAQVAPEVGDPQVVSVADLFLLVDAGQSEGQT